SGMPAAAPAASIQRNSRLDSPVTWPPGSAGQRRPTAFALLVDRRFRIEQQRQHVADLLLGQDPGRAESRHLVARLEGMRIPDARPCVPHHLGRVSAQLAVVVETGADVAEGNLVARKLVAGVAVAAGLRAGLVVVLEAAPRLRDLLALLPVAQELSVGGVLHVGERLLLDALGHLLRDRTPLVLRALALQVRLLETVEPGLPPFPERALYDLDDIGIAAAGREGGLCDEEPGAQRGDGQRDGFHVHLPAP